MKKALSVLIIVSIILSLAACGKSVPENTSETTETISSDVIETEVTEEYSTESCTDTNYNYDTEIFNRYFSEKALECADFDYKEFDTVYITDLDKNGIPEIGYTYFNWSYGPIYIVTICDGELVEIAIDYPGSNRCPPDGVYYVGNYIIMYAEGHTTGTYGNHDATIFKVENGNIIEVETVSRESLGIDYIYCEELSDDEVVLQRERIRSQMFEYLDEKYGFLSAVYHNDVCVWDNTFDYINQEVGCNIKKVNATEADGTLS